MGAKVGNYRALARAVTIKGQVAIAKKAGLSQGTISNVLNQKHIPRESTVKKLLKAAK